MPETTPARIGMALGGVLLAAATTLIVGTGSAGATIAEDNMRASCSSGTNYYDPGRTGIQCHNATIDNLNLTGVNLSGGYLYNSSFRQSNLTDANIRFARMEKSNFSDANLTRANLYGTSLDHATFDRANLADADFTYSELPLATFKGANITRTNFSNSAPSLRSKSVAPTSAAGAVVTWDLTELTDLSITSCDHAPGSLFPADTTTRVTCKLAAEWGLGEGFATFNVTVSLWKVAPGLPEIPVEMQAVAGTPLSHTFAVTGAPPPTQSVADPTTLPPGLTFDNGVLAGTPTTAGRYEFTITADNGFGPVKNRQVIITVADQVFPPAWSTGPVELQATAGAAFTRTFVTNGSQTQTVADPATLPPGLTFTDGVLAGTPTTAGRYEFTITATSGTGPPQKRDVIVFVAAAPVTPEPPATGSLGSLGPFGF